MLLWAKLMASSLSKASSKETWCAGGVGSGATKCLVGTGGQLKVRGEENADFVSTETAGRGEGVFGAEVGGVRFLDGVGLE